MCQLRPSPCLLSSITRVEPCVLRLSLLTDDVTLDRFKDIEIFGIKLTLAPYYETALLTPSAQGPLVGDSPFGVVSLSPLTTALPASSHCSRVILNIPQSPSGPHPSDKSHPDTPSQIHARQATVSCVSSEVLVLGMGCEITTCSFVTAPLTSHSQLVPDRRKEQFLFVTGPRIQIHAVTGPEQRWNRSIVTLLLASVTDNAITGPGQPCSFTLRRLLEQSYSRKEGGALCSCHSAEIRGVFSSTKQYEHSKHTWYLPKTRFEPSMTHSSSADLEESMIDTKETSEEYKMKMIYGILWAVCMFASTLTKELYDQDLLEEEVFDLQDKATSSQSNSLGLKDISVDINEDTILEFTHLQIVTSLLETDDGSVEDDRVLEGDYKVISNSVNHPFDANDEGHFSIPFHFILRAKNLEMALINKVLHSSGAPLSSTARQALKKYMKAFLKTQYNTIASIKTLNQNARPLIDSDKEISRNGEADDWLAMPMIYRNLKNTNLNEVVDFLLGIVKNDILEKGKDLLNIPDIHKDFGTGEGTSMIKGTFTATKGWIKSISTIQRTADVVLNRVGETVSVTCGLGLKVLEFGYDNYTIMAVGYHTTGTMAGSIGNNSVDLKVSLALVSTGCNATLNELKFSGSDFKISLTGLGEFSFIVSDVTTWFAELFKTHISASIGKHIQESIENTLQKFHCNHLS
uniref:(California timema) hypothetical protein n=1 Tax=Timema californicum TaxID=61474 RepID=A0A7R9P659_TIMCA|nr:unnamed protein product [Timema californicum]